MGRLGLVLLGLINGSKARMTACDPKSGHNLHCKVFDFTLEANYNVKSYIVVTLYDIYNVKSCLKIGDRNCKNMKTV